MAGLRRDSTPCPGRAVQVEPSSRLLVASRPVLDQLSADLADTPFALILADRRACVVDYRVGTHQLRDQMDGFGLAPGTVWDEETTGTRRRHGSGVAQGPVGGR